MKNSSDNTRRPRRLDLEPTVRARELISLQEELHRGGPVTEARLNRWVGASAARKELLGGSAWGVIRWRKSIGRPKTASLPDAFEIRHAYLAQKFRIGPGGVIEEISTWEPRLAPAMWDDSSATEFRVGYHFHAVYFWPNRLTFRLRDISWERPSHLLGGYHRVQTVELRFKNLGEIAVLPDVEVKFHSWIQSGIRVIPGGVTISGA